VSISTDPARQKQEMMYLLSSAEIISLCSMSKEKFFSVVCLQPTSTFASDKKTGTYVGSASACNY